MLEKQSTFALPGRLTKIALRPHLTKYLDGTDAKGDAYCGSKHLDFFSTYSRCVHVKHSIVRHFLAINVSKNADTRQLWRIVHVDRHTYPPGLICPNAPFHSTPNVYHPNSCTLTFQSNASRVQSSVRSTRMGVTLSMESITSRFIAR